MKINWKVRINITNFGNSGIFNIDITIYNAQITAISEPF